MRRDVHLRVCVRQIPWKGPQEPEKVSAPGLPVSEGERKGGLSLSHVNTSPIKTPGKLWLTTEGTGCWPRGWPRQHSPPHTHCPSTKKHRCEPTWRSHALVKGPDPQGPSGDDADKVVTERTENLKAHLHQ